MQWNRYFRYIILVLTFITLNLSIHIWYLKRQWNKFLRFIFIVFTFITLILNLIWYHNI